MAEDNGFFKKEYFDQLTNRLKSIEEKLDTQGKTIDELKGKITWIWGFGAGAGLLISIVYNYIKGKLS